VNTASPGKKRLPSRLKFLLMMVAAYAAIGLANPGLVRQALAGFAAMALKVLPILALVFVVLFLVNLLLKPEHLRRHLGAESGLMGWLWAIGAGILISGPPFVLYPMLGDFKKQGVRPALLAVFLYNRNVKIQFLPAMAYYFGLRYTVVISFLIIVFSLISGKLIEVLAEF
jgi:uncharacterized membrane protein YraQ (UPF0718 family)